ncbi:MAG: glycosyltransferase family 2 protein [Syntrophobacteraceae bacterium]
MQKLSATIITRNEAVNIGDCLRTLDWVSEVVVVDQFSDDGTADIARGMGAAVFQEPWHGFAAQKNLALDRAQGPWILSIDADERVTPALREEIETILEADGPEDGYHVARRNYFCGRWIRRGGWYPDYSLRLFRREAGRFAERAVHERVVLNGKTGYLKQPMEHFTYTSVADYLSRMERYSRLAADEVLAGGKNPGWWSMLFRPPFTFIKMYGLKGGFLDGREGFFLAISYAYYTFLKYFRATERS